VQRQGKAEIADEAALVEFVEDDEPDALECRIALQAPRENSFRDDLDPGITTHTGFGSRPEPNRAADWFPQKLGHSVSGCPGRHASRLEHDDAFAAEPLRVDQGERNERGLASAWRRLEHGAAFARERALELGENGGDGKSQGRLVIRQDKLHAARRVNAHEISLSSSPVVR
jgi:hypothetical protein